MRIFLLFLFFLAQAEGANYEIRDGVARFTLGYSGGTHQGETSTIGGRFSWDPETPGKASGLLRAPIAAIRTGEETRDCHMREALGLDYTRSVFPEEHVCTEENTLPDSGENAVVYPYIDFRVSRISAKGQDWEVSGEWRIHGASRPATISFRVEPRGQGIRAVGRTELLLSDFQVEVKSVKVLFLTIRTFDKVRLQLDLLLEPT